MCSSYRPVTREDRLLTFFGIERERDSLPAHDVFPSGMSPMIRLTDRTEASDRRERIVDSAIFRFTPDFVATQVWAKNTFNARSEEVEEKRTYKGAWAAGRRCIIPVEWFFEPRYPDGATPSKPGKSTRWRIQQPGGVPLGIAGIYREYKHPTTGEVVFAMAMLTTNADGHPVCHQFHKPGDEKRMPVILHPDDYARWLSCTPAEAKQLCRQWTGPLQAFPDPIRGRGEDRPPDSAGDEAQLF